MSETKLAEEFGLGRSPIRTALSRLESEGWVEISPQSGTFVCSLSEKEIQEFTVFRALLEAHCAGQAAGRISDKEIELLKLKFAACRPHVQAGDIDVALQLDEEVHALIYRLGGNELIANTLSSLRDKVQWIRRACAVSVLRIEAEHAFVVADQVAILAGDHFATGPVETIMTSQELSRLYGIALNVEQTPSGRLVVGPASRTIVAPL